MLETVFSTLYTSGETVSVSAFLCILGSALVLGAVYALIYQRSSRCSQSLAVALATLPAVVAVVILMVNGSIGAGIAVAGAFSLVRFRSAPGTGREIAAVFIAMAIGLACGMGSPALAALFTGILCGVDLLYSALRFGERRGEELRRTLHITVPETLEYAEVFDDIFAEYTSSAKLLRIKSTNLGSLDKLCYDITLREAGSEKALIDALRCRNGNLEIALTACAEDPAEL